MATSSASRRTNAVGLGMITLGCLFVAMGTLGIGFRALGIVALGPCVVLVVVGAAVVALGLTAGPAPVPAPVRVPAAHRRTSPVSIHENPHDVAPERVWVPSWRDDTPALPPARRRAAASVSDVRTAWATPGVPGLPSRSTARSAGYR